MSAPHDPSAPTPRRAGNAGAAASRRQRILLAICLGFAGLIHLLPLPGILGAATLERLYGLSIDTPDLLLLLRHRALLFGLLGLLLLAAIRIPAWRALAIGAGIVSTAGFLLLSPSFDTLGAAVQRVVIADIGALAALLLAAWLHRGTRVAA